MPKYSRRGMGYRHRAPTLRQRVASAWRSRRVAIDFAPLFHHPFAALFLRFGPLDQGATNACTGFAVAMAATIQAYAWGIARAVALSPVIPYWAARRRWVDADELVRDEGAYVEDVVWAFNEFGASDDASWRGAFERLDTAAVNRRPAPGEFRAALRVRSQLQLRLVPIVARGDRLVQRLVHSLHLGQVCCAALPVGPTFLDPDPDGIGAQPPGDVLGHHMVCVIDWRRRGARYELLCGNSWGSGWGDRGIAWMTPDLVAQALGAWYLAPLKP